MVIYVYISKLDFNDTAFFCRNIKKYLNTRFKNLRSRYRSSIQVREFDKHIDNFNIGNKPNRNTPIKLPATLNFNDKTFSNISKKLHRDYIKVRIKEMTSYIITNSNEKFIDNLVQKNRKKRGVSLSSDAPYEKGQTPSNKIKT